MAGQQVCPHRRQANPDNKTVPQKKLGEHPAAPCPACGAAASPSSLHTPMYLTLGVISYLIYIVDP